MSNVYQIITDKVIRMIQEGTAPWRKPWGLPPGTFPISLTTSKPYTGINVMLLGLSGYDDPRWTTYHQAKELGGQVRKGEKSSLVVFWKLQEKEDPEDAERTRRIPILRYYNVFNVQQVDGLRIPPIARPEQRFTPVEEAETIIQNMPSPPNIVHGGGRAFYQPAADAVSLPPKEAFQDPHEYYSTAFHELGHSTGHPKRLDRSTYHEAAPFGSESYSREELVAEFTRCYLCHLSGIQNTQENSAAYLRSWASKLQENDRWLVITAAQAQKAASYILGQTPAPEVEDDN